MVKPFKVLRIKGQSYSVKDSGAVRFDEETSLNSDEKERARQNIGALSVNYIPPVTSVNGETGDVVLDASDVGALPSDYTPPVTSVNGETGDVVLDASDVGALPSDYTPPVTSVNGETGNVVVDAAFKIGKSHNIAVYRGVADLGLVAGSVTIQDVFTAMSYPAIFYGVGDQFVTGQTPNRYGVVEIIRITSQRQSLHFYGWEASDMDYRMFCNPTTTPTPTGKWFPVSYVRTGYISTLTSWTTNADDYTQTVTASYIQYISSNSVVTLDIDTPVLKQMAIDGCTNLYVENNSGTLVLHAFGAPLSSSVTINCHVVEAY